MKRSDIILAKPIKDFPGYFIGENGMVFSNLGKGNRDKSKTTNLYQVKPRYTTNGYCRVYMRQESTNKRMDKYIHRLVAENFIPNPNHLPCVDHKNFIRDDNSKDNLEWCTHKTNNEKTLKSEHVVRDDLGRYVSNYDYKTNTMIE